MRKWYVIGLAVASAAFVAFYFSASSHNVEWSHLAHYESESLDDDRFRISVTGREVDTEFWSTAVALAHAAEVVSDKGYEHFQLGAFEFKRHCMMGKNGELAESGLPQINLEVRPVDFSKLPEHSRVFAMSVAKVRGNVLPKLREERLPEIGVTFYRKHGCEAPSDSAVVESSNPNPLDMYPMPWDLFDIFEQTWPNPGFLNETIGDGEYKTVQRFPAFISPGHAVGLVLLNAAELSRNDGYSVFLIESNTMSFNCGESDEWGYVVYHATIAAIEQVRKEQTHRRQFSVEKIDTLLRPKLMFSELTFDKKLAMHSENIARCPFPDPVQLSREMPWEHFDILAQPHVRPND